MVASCAGMVKTATGRRQKSREEEVVERRRIWVNVKRACRKGAERLTGGCGGGLDRKGEWREMELSALEKQDEGEELPGRVGVPFLGPRL